MKQIILLSVLIIMTLPAEAQRFNREKYRTRSEEKGEKWMSPRQIKMKERRTKQKQNTKIYFTPEMLSFYNINRWDLSEGKNGAGILNSKGNMGLAFGLGVRIESKIASSPFLVTTVGFRYVQQRLDLQHEEQIATERYNNNYLYFKLLGGYKFQVSPVHAIDFGIGIQNLQSIKGRDEDVRLTYVRYVDAVTGENLNYLKSASIVHWGNTKGKLGLISCPTIQLGYNNKSILGRGKTIRMAVEFSTKWGANSELHYNNQTYYFEFDENRNMLRTEKFNDRHTAIGLNLSIGI